MFRNVPLPIILLIASLLCPTELSVYVAGLRLPPHRIALLLLFPLAVYRMATRPDIRVRDFDLAMIAYNMATIAAHSYHGTQYIGPDLVPSNGLVFGGSVALESMVGYLVARAWIRDIEQFRIALGFLFAAVITAGLIALPETLLGQSFVHDFLQGVTGYVHPRGIEQRLGLTRAYGTFDHPILLGTFCGSILAMCWYSVRSSGARLTRAIILGATFTAVSSAPLLICAMQGMLIAWDRALRGIPRRATMTVGALVVLYFVASLFMTRSPIAFVATGLTLDPWTGFYRLMIWEHGLDNVWENPWVGLGLAEWRRPAWMASSTVDAFWLVIAMRAGIPTFMTLVLAILLLLRAVVKRGTGAKDRAVREFSRAWIFSLFAMSFAACTVHYWNAIYTYFFFFMGLAGWIADPKRAAVRKAARPAPPQPARGGYHPQPYGAAAPVYRAPPAMAGRRIEGIR
jgi:hypothetical protein